MNAKAHAAKILKFQKGKKGPDSALARAVAENMMRAEKPSPLPWSARAAFVHAKDPLFFTASIINASKTLTVAKAFGVGAKQANENAALIVRAVNSHAALVESAQRVLNCIVEDYPCECYGKPDAIYEKGEKCPPCGLKAALRAAGEVA